MKEFKLNLFDYKILSIVSCLNKDNNYPSSYGVYKLLVGLVDNETKTYQNLIAFSSCISTSSKKVSLRIKILQRHGFLANIYDEKLDKLFVKITLKGEMEITAYLSCHKQGFKKRNPHQEISISHIENKG